MLTAVMKMNIYLEQTLLAKHKAYENKVFRAFQEIVFRKLYKPNFKEHYSLPRSLGWTTRVNRYQFGPVQCVPEWLLKKLKKSTLRNIF